jgi:mannose-6-phosphate isomerase-like protein (cupin superfamily)
MLKIKVFSIYYFSLEAKMILSVNDIKAIKMEKPKDGRGILESFPYKLVEGIKGEIKMFSIMNLLKDSQVGLHKHENDNEIYLILDGTAIVNDNGNEDILNPGDMIVTVKGESHSIENKSETTVVFLAIIIE